MYLLIEYRHHRPPLQALLFHVKSTPVRGSGFLWDALLRRVRESMNVRGIDGDTIHRW